jgi:hypothetical protein
MFPVSAKGRIIQVKITQTATSDIPIIINIFLVLAIDFLP